MHKAIINKPRKNLLQLTLTPNKPIHHITRFKQNNPTKAFHPKERRHKKATNLSLEQNSSKTIPNEKTTRRPEIKLTATSGTTPTGPSQT